MIGAVYLDMAVQALLAKHSLICATGLDPGTAVDPTGMEIRQVALLAEIRLSADQEVFIVRTVR